MGFSDALIATPFGWRLRIGMPLPSSNCVAGSAIPTMLPDGVSVYTPRLTLSGGSREELLAMADRVEEAAGLRRRVVAAAGKPATTTSTALVIVAPGRNLGEPVIAGNQALAWHVLRQGRIMEQTPGFGGLFRAH